MENEEVGKKEKIFEKKGFWVIVAGIFFVISMSLILWIVLLSQSKQSLSPNTAASSLFQKLQALKKTTPKETGLVRRKIDGVYVPPGEDNYYPMAVSIDNHPDARPQSGLAKANLVFEAEVEGATTRFLAFFADNKQIDKIGPVRSARPYFIDWISGISAVFVHCGGSPEALARIIKENIADINEFYKGDLFWRGTLRSAPHNVYTSSKNIREYLKEKNLEEGKYFSWQYKDDSPGVTATGSRNILIPRFGVEWKYDPIENDYARYVSGRESKEADGKTIRAKNVIAMRVKTEVIDEKLRLRIDTIGSGQAIICLDGACQEGGWRKARKSARTRFYDSKGQEIVFNAGTTWIEVIRPEYEIKY